MLNCVSSSLMISIVAGGNNLKIQVAFQGGGARFVDMLPVIQAIKQFNKKDLTVTNVHGTSSGSICAALLALDGSINDLRNFAKTEGDSLLRATSPEIYDGTILRKSFFGRLPAVGRIIAGDPLVEMGKFKSFIRKLLESYGMDAHSIGEINANPKKPNLSISVANLQNENGQLLIEGDLVDAIAKSCAFPFAIKNFASLSDDPHVDGGVTENLPSESLPDPHDHGLKLLVCPVSNGEPKLPHNILSFFSKLLSTSINHQVQKEKIRVGDGFLFEIPTDIEIHEIKKALHRLGDDDWFDANVREHTRRLKSIIQSQPNDEGTGTLLTTRPPIDYYQRELFKIHDRIFTKHPYRILRLSEIVTANSLKSGATISEHEVDRIEREVLIQVGDKGLTAFRSRAPLNDGKQVPTLWVVYDVSEHGKRIELPVTALPVQVPEDRGEMPGSNLLMFDGQDPDVLIGKTLLIKSIYYHEIGMSPLLTQIQDSVAFRHTYPFNAELAEVILLYPTSFRQIDAGLNGSCQNIETFETFRDLPDDRIVAKPNDFKLVGGRCRSLSAHNRLCVDFFSPH